MAQKIIGLHGFGGRFSDFDQVQKFIAIEGPNLFERGSLDSTHDFKSWTKNFIEHYGEGRPWLLGYSLGGRLALHVAALYPQKIGGVIAISTHPGRSPDPQRSEWETDWQNIFLNDPLAFQKWQTQEIFKNTKSISMHDQDRKLLALSFTNWSSQKHLFDPTEIKNVDWVVGEHDEMYRKILSAYHPKIIFGAGHRIHLDAPRALADHIQTIINETRRTTS